MKRQSGVLMHVSSLWGDYSIGSFGREAFEFIDFLYDSGFTIWQVLPFGMTDSYNSPYKSSASFGANPYFIDLPTLNKKGYITDNELAEAKGRDPYLCEFERLSKERINLLFRAASRALSSDEVCRDVDSFLDEHPELLSVSKFLSLSEKNQGKAWQKWTDDTPDPDKFAAWKFIQYEFYKQWMSVKEYANRKGISIIGDLPMYVDLDSADVWSAPHQFLLDSDNIPTAVAGVPPDAFSEEGQLWANPLYNWKEMKKDGYLWWKRRISHALTLFDGVRIDHFRAIESYWSIPRTAISAKEGKWVKGPGRSLVDAIRSVAGDKLVIAEDLGVITKEVESLLKYSKLPGMRVFQFAFADDEDNTHLPHNYSENCIAYTGTHDNNTLLGYLYEIDDTTRKILFSYCGINHDSDISDAVCAVRRHLLSSHAAKVIFPIQDILGFGCDTRMNTPGVASGNWAYRITKEQLYTINKSELNSINKLYFRI